MASVMEKNQSIHVGVEHTGFNRHVLVEFCMKNCVLFMGDVFK